MRRVYKKQNRKIEITKRLSKDSYNKPMCIEDITALYPAVYEMFVRDFVKLAEHLKKYEYTPDRAKILKRKKYGDRTYYKYFCEFFLEKYFHPTNQELLHLLDLCQINHKRFFEKSVELLNGVDINYYINIYAKELKLNPKTCQHSLFKSCYNNGQFKTIKHAGQLKLF